MTKNLLIYIYFLAIAFAGFFGVSCIKLNIPPTYSVSALNVVNALPASAPLIFIRGSITPAIGNFSGIGSLSYGAAAVLTPPSGSELLYVLQKNGDTASVTAQAGGDFMFNGSLSFAAGNLYSLFITGADTSHPDFLFVKDTVNQQTDSTVGIRFVNLSTGSDPVSVNIKGQANGNVVSNLEYKNITGFMSFPATSTISSYIFEFRDAANSTLLASYKLSGVNTNSSTAANTVLFSNLTIALIGQPTGGKVMQTCMLVTNTRR